MEEHRESVDVIRKKVESLNAHNVPFRIYHGSTNITRPMNLNADEIIDTSPLSKIISINKTKKTAIVQPNVSMDAFVRETLRSDLIPAVVPDFPGITVGGSFCGTAAESSSFKYGCFDRTVNWVEIVLPNGLITTASPDQNSDLFYRSVGAMGTLGVATLFEIQLISSSTYVEITYHSVTSIRDALITGRFKNYPPLKNNHDSGPPVVRLSRAKDPWFCLHVHKKAKHTPNTHCIICLWEDKIATPFDDSKGYEEPIMTELIKITDYLFRYDRGSFWMGCYGLDTLPLPFNRFTRWILDPMFRTRIMYKLMHHSGQSQKFIIQDAAIPVEKSEEFLEFADENLKLYPLWLCPVKGESKAPLHTMKGYISPPSNDQETPTIAPTALINVGLWGVPDLGERVYNDKNIDEFIKTNRGIERKVQELGGLKWLYAHNYYTEDEFWAVYDKKKYDELREKWHAKGVPSIWEKAKTHTEGFKSISVPKAILATMLGMDYLLGGKKDKKGETKFIAGSSGDESPVGLRK
ncbi:related to 24-dehydrocholesterol reductase precursor [Phialocephala subalpina]|uniref:Delta(24)-sterol reductase n=1 Tax=Phialocephala subalpina TaxID=576137 RepID=A0A1L7WVK3_9HELO|nr:related to 24-dehydrocholesterol reductase precursor [Phialocephala subalpina]